MGAASGDPRRPRRLRRALVAGLLGLLLLELALRAVLFAPPAALAPLAARLRRAERFAVQWQDDYWKLRYLFRNPEHERKPKRHPLLGWRRGEVDPGDYDHADHAALDGRRPLLLYGDSFAACVTPPGECWEGLLAASPHGASLALLNYGTGGYGFDQIYLMARESLPRYRGEDPLVVVSVLVDDDLDRAGLRMRGWPKPYLVPSSGGPLELERPVAEDEESFLKEYPLGIRSYAWRYLVCTLFPEPLKNWFTGRGAAQDRTQERTRTILEALERQLRLADVEFFVLLFHGPTSLAAGGHGGWRESVLVSELERLRMPWVSSAVELLGRGDAALFFDEDSPRRGHYTPLGNQAVFETLVRGIEGRYDGPGP